MAQTFTVDDLADISGITFESIEDSSFVPEVGVEITINPGNEKINLIAPHAPDQTQDKASRKRQKRSNPAIWKKTLNKQKRMRGEQYEGFKRAGKSTTKPIQITKPPKSLGSACNSKKCERSKVFKCKNLSPEDRQTIFNTFWKNLDWGQRQIYTANLIVSTPVKVKTKRDGESSRRSVTRMFYIITSSGEKIRVCKSMFLATYGISDKQIRKWTSLSRTGMPTASSPRTMNKSTDYTVRIEHVGEFLDSLPKMPSHYRRKKSTKEYLEPIISSKNHLYKIYKQHSVENSMTAVSFSSFHRVFEDKNLFLFQPKNDQCDICCAHKVGNLTDLEWNSHIEQKNRAREEKEADKANAKLGLCHVLTMDVEAVKLSPSLKASALYFKTKLCVHNFTVYDLSSQDVRCYWWSEVEGDLTASTFASCLIDYIEDKFIGDDLPIIIYSDGCTNQNRNAILANALAHLAVNSKKIVTQKFLEKGHTQMECDSVHSTIETKLKNKEIHLPSYYARICKEARANPRPYETRMLTHSFFRNYSKKETMRYDSIRPGKKVGDPVVVDIHLLKYNIDGTIEYKLNYNDNWKELPHRPKLIEPHIFPPLHNGRLKITEKKFNDLQNLKIVLPEDCHSFYDTLPH